MTAKTAKERSYKQLCGVAQALDLVGERWTLLIIRDLLLGPLRFSELLELEQGIGPNLLSRRLRTLVDRGWVSSEQEGRTKVYALTAEGERLRPVILALGEFGSAYLSPKTAGRGRLDWFAFSLQRRVKRIAHTVTVELVGSSERFAVRVGPGVEVRRGSGVGIEARIIGELPGFVQWIAFGRSWQSLVDAGTLRVEGDEEAVGRFEKCFRS